MGIKRRYKKPSSNTTAQPSPQLSLGPKEVSQYGAAVLILIPQMCTFYFFYGVVPPPAEFDAHHSHSSKITFSTMYVGPPKYQHVILILVFLPILWSFLKCCKGCLPGLIRSSMPRKSNKSNSIEETEIFV